VSNGMLYIAIGDSTGWTNATENYPSKTHKYLQTKLGYTIKHLNKSIGGATSTEVLANKEWLGNFQADLITFGVGLNDCSTEVATGTENYKTNLRTMIDRFRVKNTNVKIIMCNPSRTTDVNRVDEVAAYRTALAELVGEYSRGVYLCPFEDAWAQEDTDSYCSDGLHPQEAGQALLASELETIINLIA